MDVVSGLVRRLKRTHISGRKHDNLDKQNDFVDFHLQVDQEEKNLAINLTRGFKALILEMHIAGIETTATTIEWGVAELVRNPNVMIKAQEEVIRVTGKKGKVDEEDIRQMDYLMCIIKETCRLHPSVPNLLPRESYESSNVGGYRIPRKTRVLVKAQAIQRDPELWMEAEEFIPERFMSKTIDLKGQDFEFIPFGFGRRICPGMSFGMAMVVLTIANLLYWFDWELPGNANEVGLDMTEAFGLGLGKKICISFFPYYVCG